MVLVDQDLRERSDELVLPRRDGDVVDEEEQLRQGSTEDGATTGDIDRRRRRVAIRFRSVEIESVGLEEEEEEGEEGREDAEEEEEGGDQELLEYSEESVDLVEIVFLGEVEESIIGGGEEVAEERRNGDGSGRCLHCGAGGSFGCRKRRFLISIYIIN